MKRKKKNPAFDKEALRKDIAKDERRKARETKERLRAEVKAAREGRREVVRGAVGKCKAARRAVRDRFADARKARDDARKKREAARGVCAAPDGASAKAAEAAARKKLADELRFQRDMRRIESANRAKSRRERSSARVVNAESDDEVRANIPADLVSLFNRVRRQIKGSARKSRTEAFLEYVEAHPKEVRSSVNDEADEEVERLVAELREREAREAHPNPPLVAVDPRHGELVALGLLTRIDLVKGSVRFSLRTAPVLSYHVCKDGRCDVPGKLVIVERTKSAPGVKATTESARREYARTHWGEKGSRPTIPGRIFAGGAVRIVGVMRSVTYTTVKRGDDGELADYVHAFEKELPVLGESGGLFVVLGGSYRVEPRGIVG